MTGNSQTLERVFKACIVFLFGGAMLVITLMGAVVMLMIIRQLLFAIVGVGPIADVIRAFASVLAFVIVLWVVIAMESGDSIDSRSFETSSSSSKDYYIDTEEASESLDRIEDELN